MDILRLTRKSVHECAIERLTRQLKSEEIKESLVITQQESEYLISYFTSQLLFVCSEKRFDYKITNTAVAFLTRFYLKRSVLEFDPRRILLTCILLAIKTEDLSMAITLHHFCDGLISPKGVRLSSVIDGELPVLDALSFHLLVLQPRTAIHYLTTEYFQRHKTTEIPNTATASEKQTEIKRFGKLIHEGNREAERLALETFEDSEIPFAFTPSQIGIACFLQTAEGKLPDAETFVSSILSSTDAKCKLFDSVRPKILELRTRIVLMTESKQQERERTQKGQKIMKKLDKVTKLIRKEKEIKKQKTEKQTTINTQ